MQPGRRAFPKNQVSSSLLKEILSYPTRPRFVTRLASPSPWPSPSLPSRRHGRPSLRGRGNATVTVVHGIPDTPVDVYVDGSKALSDFTFKTVTKPISLPAGAHAVAVRKAGDPASAAPILSANPSLPAGANATIVANLTAGGKPTLTPFVNPTSSVPDGMARLVVRHTAAAPAVDILAGGKPVITSLTNPNEKMLMVPAGSLSASVAAAGTTKPVIGPVPLPSPAAPPPSCTPWAASPTRTSPPSRRPTPAVARLRARSTPAPVAWPLTPAASAWAPAWPPSPALRSCSASA